MDSLNLAAALATVAAFLLALWQFLGARHRAQTEAERIALQRERLRNSARVAIASAEVADLVVQRTKDPNVTMPELQNIARTLRMNLSLLAKQLGQEDRHLANWHYGQLIQSSQEVTKDASGE